MKIAWVHYFSFVVLTCGLACAQQPSTSPSNILAYEDGRISNNVYTNECFGFSFAIPDSWETDTQLVGADGKAGFIFQWQLYLLQLDHREHEGGRSFSSAATLKARLATTSDMTAEEFVSNMVHEQIDVAGQSVGWKLVHDTYNVGYGGRRFFRADYKEIVKGDDADTIYFSVVYTKFRGNFIGAALMARSLELLDHTANILENISFGEDERNPNCVVAGSPNHYPPGFNFPEPVTPPVRVSEGVAQALLIKKVEPQYPDDAARIQGQVVLKALIDKNGNVETLKVVSGPVMLLPAAIDAVKQWKYKPYLLNGEPVAVETQVTVAFHLSGN